MAWPAYALRHGDALFFSTRALHPSGINLPANTSFLAISLPLAPVTWVFGPVASLNVAATLAPVATALSARALLLRWTTWQPAAFLAGLFYGFSPFVIENLTLQHVEFATLVVPPLLVWCLDELLVRQRGRAWAWGLALGGLCTLQFFLSSELLVVCVLAAAIGVGLLVVAGLVRDRRAVAAAWATPRPVWPPPRPPVSCSWPTRPGTPWPGPRALPARVYPDIQYFGSAWRTLLLPADAHDRGPNAILETYGYFGSHPLLLGYLGLGMAAVLVVGLVWFRRDGRLWFCAAMLVILELLSLGAVAWPWRLVDHLPLVGNVVPDRIAGIADLFAAAMFGVILDRARAWGPAAEGRHLPRPGTAVAWMLAAVALVPLALQYRLPFTTRPVDVPPWFTTVGPTVPTTDVVLTYPTPSSGLRAPMTWQAVGGLRWSLVGGGGVTPTPPAHPTARQRADARGGPRARQPVRRLRGAADRAPRRVGPAPGRPPRLGGDDRRGPLRGGLADVTAGPVGAGGRRHVRRGAGRGAAPRGRRLGLGPARAAAAHGRRPRARLRGLHDRTCGRGRPGPGRHLRARTTRSHHLRPCRRIPSTGAS